MAQSLPYLSSNKNVGALFDKIRTSQKPSTFTQEHLRDIIGLKGSNDRPLIPLLRNLGFLDSANRPTSTYDPLKNNATAKAAIANGIKTAYEPLFKANEKANELTGEHLKGLISQVSGEDEVMVSRIAGTFSALVKIANFAAEPILGPKPSESNENDEDAAHDQAQSETGAAGALRPDFHYNIQIHLPGNGTEETYLNIFNALRRTFK